MEITFFWSMLTIFYGFLIVMFAIYDVQSSVSNIWYVLPDKYKVIFSLVTWMYGLLGYMIFPSWFTFFALVGLGFVGAAPQCSGKRYEVFAHIGGAMLSVISSQLLIIYGLALPIVTYTTIIIITLIALLSLEYIQDLWSEIRRTKTTWQEVIVFTSVAVAYAIKLF